LTGEHYIWYASHVATTTGVSGHFEFERNGVTMPLGEVSNADFDKELIELGIISPNGNDELDEEVIDIQRGRGHKKETPEETRKEIASEAICGASVKSLIEEYGISQSSISAYKKGATSTTSYHNPDEELKKSNGEVVDRITGRAQKKLLSAIDAIEFGDSIKPQTAASIANQLSSVVKNLRPDPSAVTINQNKVVVFRPRMKEEDDFQTIEVMEN